MQRNSHGSASERISHKPHLYFEVAWLRAHSPILESPNTSGKIVVNQWVFGKLCELCTLKLASTKN